ncbi:hypothetical protein [Pseudobacteriovorax antillogorgiicola]|uniref:Uncharacterized protein n=1 Tax=Pseudobacteriovorax antillogorgiicola TaxID=1513793 RepID=A0A1Y6CKR2_9BACT|nr:hypothetical protein [Pseudobacteriovorax antillogorgiicola]TCS48253.1 hypothetical protein EDD56_11833 [Pseudobacteriovorax antillogorgiicola]SMF57215.1 hypothetical protein SAMN06296036_118108 [Pseudobacteriovorax antillogorgiicola]
MRPGFHVVVVFCLISLSTWLAAHPFEVVKGTGVALTFDSKTQSYETKLRIKDQGNEVRVSWATLEKPITFSYFKDSRMISQVGVISANELAGTKIVGGVKYEGFYFENEMKIEDRHLKKLLVFIGKSSNACLISYNGAKIINRKVIFEHSAESRFDCNGKDGVPNPKTKTRAKQKISLSSLLPKAGEVKIRNRTTLAIFLRNRIDRFQGCMANETGVYRGGTVILEGNEIFELLVSRGKPPVIKKFRHTIPGSFFHSCLRKKLEELDYSSLLVERESLSDMAHFVLKCDSDHDASSDLHTRSCKLEVGDI